MTDQCEEHDFAPRYGVGAAVLNHICRDCGAVRGDDDDE